MAFYLYDSYASSRICSPCLFFHLHIKKWHIHHKHISVHMYTITSFLLNMMVNICLTLQEALFGLQIMLIWPSLSVSVHISAYISNNPSPYYQGQEFSSITEHYAGISITSESILFCITNEICMVPAIWDAMF